MSAFICSKLHIQTIAQHYVQIMKTGDALEIANILHRENIKSVNYRYDEKTRYRAWKNLNDVQPVSLVQLYKLVQCLDYQSCEHNEWKASKAYSLLVELEATIVPEIVNTPKELEINSSVFSLELT